MLSEAGLEQTQLSFHYTWVEGKTYRISFESKSTNHVRHHPTYLGLFDCICVRDQLQCPHGSYNPWHCRGSRIEAGVVSRNVECPVHTPETSKAITEALKRVARQMRRLSGSARELYLEQASRSEPGCMQEPTERHDQGSRRLCLDCGEHLADQSCPHSRFSLLEID